MWCIMVFVPSYKKYVYIKEFLDMDRLDAIYMRKQLNKDSVNAYISVPQFL